MDFTDVAKWFAGAVIVVGLMEWSKVLFKKALNVELPGWLLLLLLPIISMAVGFAAGDQGLWTALGIWAFAQVGYAGILKKMLEKTGTGP